MSDKKAHMPYFSAFPLISEELWVLFLKDISKTLKAHISSNNEISYEKVFIVIKFELIYIDKSKLIYEDLKSIWIN